MIHRMVLLNPGPVTLSDRVRAALTRPDECHREEAFAEVMLDIRQRLLEVYPAAKKSHVAIVLTGSGTLAVEAMLASLIPAGGRALAAVNGVYGERMVAMLQAHGKAHCVVQSDWLAPLDLPAIERQLASDPTITHVAAVHHETTTGRLNDITALGRLCRQFDRRLLLDAVSSFGAEFLDFENWNVEAAAATANKCLHGVPGTALVVARRDAIENQASAAQSVYLDLHRYAREQVSGFSPFTPAVQSCFALQEALRELADFGGWTARQQCYLERSAAVRRFLAELGISPLLASEASSSSLSAFYLPTGLTYAALHDELREAGFVVYASQGRLAQQCFRIATMGDIRADDFARLQSALKRVLRAALCPT